MPASRGLPARISPATLHEEDHFATFFAHAPVAYLVLDEDGEVRDLNQAGCELLGWSATWLTGRPLCRWILRDDLSLFERHLEAAMALGRGRQRLRLKTRSGRVRDVLLESNVLRDTEASPRFLVVIIDISEHGRDERQVRAEWSKLMHADRVGMMGEMASNLAHELSQPIGAILLNANACTLMVTRSTAPDAARLSATLERICESATYAGEMIFHLRKYLSATEGAHQHIDLNALVQKAMRMMEPDARDRDVTIRLDLSPTTPSFVGDMVQIEQVLLNLVRNGIDAISEGQPRQITVRTLRYSEDQVAFSVSDTGPGISARVADHLFDPFFTTKATGMGLGLSISRTIVEAHMGRLWWAPEATPGATFLCSLPIGIGVVP